MTLLIQSITCQNHTNTSIQFHNHKFPCIFQASYFKSGRSINQTVHKYPAKENSVTCSGSRSSQTSSLRREEYPHSSCRLSLRRDYDSGLGRVCGSSL